MYQVKEGTRTEPSQAPRFPPLRQLFCKVRGPSAGGRWRVPPAPPRHAFRAAHSHHNTRKNPDL